jgi:hypothetical protein
MSLDTCVYTAHIMLYTLVTRIAYHYAVEEYSSRDCTIQNLYQIVQGRVNPANRKTKIQFLKQYSLKK